jgi:hypothetical protein
MYREQSICHTRHNKSATQEVHAVYEDLYSDDNHIHWWTLPFTGRDGQKKGTTGEKEVTTMVETMERKDTFVTTSGVRENLQ